MPLERGAALQLGVLLLAVPMQYLLTQYMSTTPTQRSLAVKSVLTSARQMTSSFLSWESWEKWCRELITAHLTPGDDRGESPAVEVINFENPRGYFAGSSEVRSPRPAEVKFRVGQVVRHKRWGYRGVIIGWDEIAKAPQSWLNQMHPKDKPHWRTQPNYSVLVDTRDRSGAQVTYVTQENLDVILDTKIYHPEVDTFFEAYDGAQYLPRPFLTVLYPHD